MTSTGRWARAMLLPIVIVAIAGCRRAGGSPESDFAADVQDARQADAESLDDHLSADHSSSDVVGRLSRMRAAGRFEEFIDRTLREAQQQTNHAELQALASEAWLATGRSSNGETSAMRAAELAADEADWDLTAHALKLWTTARFRQSQALDETRFRELVARLPVDDPSAQMLAFWHDSLGGRVPYRLASADSSPVELPQADATRGSVPFELGAISASANGEPMPLVFIDTGAQHTLVTAEAAQAAGIISGTGGAELVGFAGLTGRPAVIETLALGDLVLYDVPVLVGDSAPLVALSGQMSLGSELMHHIRFHVDYPARRVTAEPARHAGRMQMPPPIWDIPVWTFPQICLARGQLAAGPMARVLVDTGNRSGTFVSYRWARRHMPQLRGVDASLVFRFKKRNLTLEMLDLGSQSLATWPVTDTMPAELDRLNLVDVILGHDLLWPYQLTIDLPRRILELRPGTTRDAAAPPGER